VTTTDPATPGRSIEAPGLAPLDLPVRSTRAASTAAFGALLLRDLVVLRKNLREFIPRTVLQPLLLVFVFTYVFPKIGQGVGGATGASGFSTLLVAGVIGLAVLFQGIQAVALPMVTEFGVTREIEDRVLAPLPVSMVAIEKIVSGAIQGLFAALIVFPIAAIVPATPVHLQIHWVILLTFTPLACIMCSALGLMFGTVFNPRTVPMLFGVVVLPITFLGCIYYTWASLAPIRWLQVTILVNPLVYVSEGFRAALTDVPTMSLWAVYPVVIGFTVLFGTIGIRFFRRRVIA
jgi:ABC-2 type transport system permease protein